MPLLGQPAQVELIPLSVPKITHEKHSSSQAPRKRCPQPQADTPAASILLPIQSLVFLPGSCNHDHWDFLGAELIFIKYNWSCMPCGCSVYSRALGPSVSLQNHIAWLVPGLSGQTGFSICFRITGAAWVVIHHLLEPAGRMVAESVAGDPGPWGHKERALTYGITAPVLHHTACLACMVITGTCVRLLPRFPSLMLPPVPCVFVSPKPLPYLSRG